MHYFEVLVEISAKQCFDSHCCKQQSQQSKSFNYQNVKVIDCVACSSDLNPLENIWGIVCHKVYSNGMADNTYK